MLDGRYPPKHNILMTPEQRQVLNFRWHEIERELADLFDGKVTADTDPAAREGELLEEQDAIEFELGADQLSCGFDESWQEDL